MEIDSGDLIIHEPEQLFRPVLQKIVDVFRKHVDRIPPAQKPQSILLVGGFSSSQVLQARLEAEFGCAGVRVFPVLGAWQAVVKGAVLSAIKPRAFTRRMRHAFGFTTNEPWNAMLHGGPAVRAVDVPRASGVPRHAAHTSSKMRQPSEKYPGKGPRVEVLKRIVGIGDEVKFDEERKIGGNYTAIKKEQRTVNFPIYVLKEADLPAGELFEDFTTSPGARRFVPWYCPLKTVPYVIPRSAVKMDLEVPLPPLAAGQKEDRRHVCVWAKFGGTEFTVRVDVFVDKVKVPEFSKQIPIDYGSFDG